MSLILTIITSGFLYFSYKTYKKNAMEGKPLTVPRFYALCLHCGLGVLIFGCLFLSLLPWALEGQLGDLLTLRLFKLVDESLPACFALTSIIFSVLAMLINALAIHGTLHNTIPMCSKVSLIIAVAFLCLTKLIVLTFFATQRNLGDPVYLIVLETATTCLALLAEVLACLLLCDEFAQNVECYEDYVDFDNEDNVFV